MVRSFSVKGLIPSVRYMFLFWLQAAFALSPEERDRGEEGKEEKESQRIFLHGSSITPYTRLASASRVVVLKHALPHHFLGCWFVFVFRFMYMFGFCWYYLYFIFPDMVSTWKHVMWSRMSLNSRSPCISILLLELHIHFLSSTFLQLFFDFGYPSDNQ